MKPTPKLHVVLPSETSPSGETVGQRVRRLQASARALAADHVEAFAEAMADLETLAAEIATGGDAYSVGVRELARTLAEDLNARSDTLDAIRRRAR